MEQLGDKLCNIYTENYDKTTNKQESLEMAVKFLDGVNFSRVQIDFKLLSDFGKELLKLLFSSVFLLFGKITSLSKFYYFDWKILFFFY